ncbi:MAG: hypothetical protein JOZ44_02040 [Acidobacteria bacterium]|nr:hypothetical protein [Acidobacteriota bacterium]
MRRVIANSLLVITLALFFSPALTAVTTQPIPICCRRGGMHHCAMMAQMIGREQGTVLHANNPCPMRHESQIGTAPYGLPASESIEASSVQQLLSGVSSPNARVVAFFVSRERGPPSPLSSAR